MLLLGVGAGLSFPSLMTIAMSGAEPHEAGLASGLVNTAMQVGGALGLAVLATLSASRAKDLLASGASSADAISSGLHLALVIGAGLVISAIVVGVTVLAPARALGQAPAEVAERDDAPLLSDELYSEAA
jgi:MFS family permease